MSTRIHLSEEEVYDIFKQIFHHEEDALAATIQLFGGDSWDEEEQQKMMRVETIYPMDLELHIEGTPFVATALERLRNWKRPNRLKEHNLF